MVQLTKNTIDHSTITEQVRSNRTGAVVTFLGTVREFTGNKQTSSLEYEAYPEMAELKLQQVESEARSRWPIVELVIVHRVGHLEVGDISVAIAVSCPHRSQAFDACRYVIDRIKESVPIWKCENWATGESEWVHPGLGTDTEPHNEHAVSRRDGH
jgi:molybdopterin synthase catalytic subunit